MCNAHRRGLGLENAILFSNHPLARPLASHTVCVRRPPALLCEARATLRVFEQEATYATTRLLRNEREEQGALACIVCFIASRDCA